MVSLLSAQTCLTNLSSSPNLLDRDSQALGEAINFLGQHQLLGLKLGREFGGAGFSKLEYAYWQISVARFSGALAFLQTQHQSAGSLLQASNNHLLQQEYLSAMATGKKLVGVGFSQLRYQRKPLVTAERGANGYSISGVVPWVSGNKFFANFIVGATLADGQELYALIPLTSLRQSHGGSIAIGEAMDLISMASTNTVSVSLDRWKVSDDRVVQLKPPGSIHLSSRDKVLNPSWFALGVAHSAIDILEKIYQQKKLDFILQTIDSLKFKLDIIKQKMLAAIANNTKNYQEKLQLRSQAINLAFRCAQAAVISSSGAANKFSNDAGRVYREVIMFNATAQTQDVMEASLNQLCSEV